MSKSTKLLLVKVIYTLTKEKENQWKGPQNQA